MKNVGKSIGKAVLYFLVYLIPQVILSGVFSVVLTTKLTLEMMGADGTIDAELLTEKVMEAVTEQAITITLIAGIITLIILWIVFLVRKKNFLEETSIRSMDSFGILPIIVVAVGFNIIVSVLLQTLPFPQSWIESYQQSSSLIETGNVLAAWVSTVLLAPVLEEIIFRGLVYTRLKQGMPMLVAAVLTSLLFGVMHGTIIWGIYTFVFSMLLIWVFERFQSLAANILFHFGFNLTGMILSYVDEIAGAVLWVLFAAAVIAFAAGVWVICKKAPRIQIEEES